jgi:DNA-binding transcriptional LysR family regulator
VSIERRRLISIFLEIEAPPDLLRRVAGLGVVALPGYVCHDDVKSGALRRVLPDWIAGDSTLTALIPYRQGLLPSVRAFIEHLAAEFPKAVVI